MKDNYPMGAALDPNAPYNMPPDPEPIEVDCSVCYCISKSIPVSIENYIEGDEGISFDDTNFIEEFKADGNAIGIPALLNELQRLSEWKIEQLSIELTMTNRFTPEGTREQILKDIKYYESIVKASKDWVIDDLDVYKDE